MEEWRWRRRCSPPPRVLAVGRILPFPFPGAVESSVEGLCTPRLRHYHVNRSTLIEGGREGGREGYRSPRGYTHEATRLLRESQETPSSSRGSIYIFLRIGGRKSALQICPLFFLKPLN